MAHRNIRMVELNDTEVYPISKSAEGTNAYYCEFCQYAGYRPSYASCLRRMADRKEGRLISNEASCSAAIGNKVCPALAMKAEEKQAGHAIYYVNRIKLRQNQVENAELVGIKLGQRASRGLKNPAPRLVSPQDSDVLVQNVPQGIPHAPEFKSQPTLADALNKKIGELTKDAAITSSSSSNASTSTRESVSFKNKVSGDLSKKEPSSKGTSTPINTEGLSLLEIARLRKQQPTA